MSSSKLRFCTAIFVAVLAGCGGGTSSSGPPAPSTVEKDLFSDLFDAIVDAALDQLSDVELEPLAINDDLVSGLYGEWTGVTSVTVDECDPAQLNRPLPASFVVSPDGDGVEVVDDVGRRYAGGQINPAVVEVEWEESRAAEARLIRFVGSGETPIITVINDSVIDGTSCHEELRGIFGREPGTPPADNPQTVGE